MTRGLDAIDDHARGMIERGLEQLGTVGEMVRHQTGGRSEATRERSQRESFEALLRDEFVRGACELGAAVGGFPVQRYCVGRGRGGDHSNVAADRTT